jgi:hypothetical protein
LTISGVMIGFAGDLLSTILLSLSEPGLLVECTRSFANNPGQGFDKLYPMLRTQGFGKCRLYRVYKALKLNMKRRGKLDELAEIRGKPGGLRVDNGPELISEELERRARAHGVERLFIQPGLPMLMAQSRSPCASGWSSKTRVTGAPQCGGVTCGERKRD